MPGDKRITELDAMGIVGLDDLFPIVKSGVGPLKTRSAQFLGDLPKSSTTVVVAASDTPNPEPRADYLCSGTNDEVEIQAAIDDLPAFGGRVVLLEGTYNVNIPDSTDVAFELVSDTIFEGMGNATKINLISYTSGDSVAPVIEVNNKENIIIRNLLIDGNWEDAITGSLGIRLELCDNILVENVEIVDTDSHFLAVRGSTNILLRRIVTSTVNGSPSTNHGVDLDYETGGSTTPCENILVVDSLLSNADGYHRCEHSINTTYLNNVFSHDLRIDTNDLPAAYTEQVLVLGNRFIDTAQLVVGGVSGVINIIGNSVESGGGGIQTDGTVGGGVVNIIGNSLRDPSTNNGAIRIISPGNYSIIGNILNEIDQHGIQIIGTNMGADSMVFCEGNKIIGLGVGGKDGIRVVDFDGGVYRNNYLYNFHNGIELNGSSFSVLDGNSIDTTVGSGDGILLTGTSTDNHVRHNDLWDIDGDGIKEAAAADNNNRIIGNTFRSISGAEITLNGAGSTAILNTHDYTGIIERISNDNVANPPTDAQIDTAFGTPATVGPGFMGLIDDNGAANNMWLCVSDGALWWYEELTKAL